MKLITGALPYWELAKEYRQAGETRRSTLITLGFRRLVKTSPHECIRDRAEKFIETAFFAKHG